MTQRQRSRATLQPVANDPRSFSDTQLANFAAQSALKRKVRSRCKGGADIRQHRSMHRLRAGDQLECGAGRKAGCAPVLVRAVQSVMIRCAGDASLVVASDVRRGYVLCVAAPAARAFAHAASGTRERYVLQKTAPAAPAAPIAARGLRRMTCVTGMAAAARARDADASGAGGGPRVPSDFANAPWLFPSGATRAPVSRVGVPTSSSLPRWARERGAWPLRVGAWPPHVGARARCAELTRVKFPSVLRLRVILGAVSMQTRSILPVAWRATFLPQGPLTRHRMRRRRSRSRSMCGLCRGRNSFLPSGCCRRERAPVAWLRRRAARVAP